MAKEFIRFKGLSLNRDEQSAAHGELSLCAGVELHDGALRSSVFQGSKVQHDESGTMRDSVLQVQVSSVQTPVTLLYVHETPSYRHFIAQQAGKLYWFNSDGTVGSPLVQDAGSDPATYSHTPIYDFGSATIISVNSVGNTLIVLATTGVHYVLWKSATEGYKYIGDQIPFLNLKFRPSENDVSDFSLSELTKKLNIGYPLDVWVGASSGSQSLTWDYGTEIGIKDGYQATISEGIRALLNPINHKIAEKGRFYAPFIIRYCYRLYDGSMTMCSSPVFMNVSSPKAFRVYAANLGCQTMTGTSGQVSSYGDDISVNDTNGNSVGVGGFGIVYKPNSVCIRYSTMGTDASNSVLESLKEDWSDIVKSVDIFISPMLTRENLDGLPTSAKPEVPNNGVQDAQPKAFKTDMYIGGDGGSFTTSRINYEIAIPLASEEEYFQRVKDCSTFYKIKSFDIKTDTIGTNGDFTDLDIEKEVVLTLTSQELMVDDYHSHDKLVPIDEASGMYVYNHRLNLYGMNEQLFEGFNIFTMINETSPIPVSSDYTDVVTVTDIYIKLETEDGVKYVAKHYSNLLIREYSLCDTLLFYPDSRATKMMMYYRKNLVDYMITLSMEPCNFLNGAVSTGLFYKTKLEGDITTPAPAPTVDANFPMPNKVITSEADNPYFFPAAGRNSVGNGRISGVAAVTRALSQGQVGDHDLMVFSTDGIWALKVSSEGTYMAMHNISREVCSNPKSICQLDQSVVFATQRNLVQFRESDMASISEMLDGPVPDWKTLLPSLYSTEFPADGTPAQQLIHKLLDFGTAAVELFNNGSIFYDHASARVVVLPANTADESVAMVWSLRDEAWSTMVVPAIKAVVPGYPSPFVQLGDGKVMIMDIPYNYAGGVDVPAIPGLIITRTLTFSDTMDVIRGYCQYGDSAQSPTLYIYGSNDQRTWRLLGKSSRWFYNYLPGTSYRFFRIAVYMQMKPSEEYQQLEVEYVNKYAKL